MRLYFAGNFPQMSKPEVEKKMMNYVLEDHPHYLRLLTFYYKEDTERVIKATRKEGSLNEEI